MTKRTYPSKRIDYLTARAAEEYALARVSLSIQEEDQHRANAEEFLQQARELCERSGIVPVFLPGGKHEERDNS